ncbi:MAG: hypothetical protein JRD93_16995 [Deltaproteobacteria bacterium]|nr:hypothetical protein [Deltaproteobacteria bacterium]
MGRSTRPFIKRFKTDKNNYVYDVNTNRLIVVDDPVYDIFEFYGELPKVDISQKFKSKYSESCVEKAFDEIEEAIQKQDLFLSDKPQ